MTMTREQQKIVELTEIILLKDRIIDEQNMRNAETQKELQDFKKETLEVLNEMERLLNKL